MQREHVPFELSNLAFEFFFWFSRFEFALKENGFLETHKPGSLADPGWREFVEKYQANYSPSQNASLLLSLGPKEQIVGSTGAVEWRTIVFRDKVSNLKEVVYVLKTVRNNLFHGGKHGETGWDDPERMAKLLTAGRSVLDELALLGSLEADYQRRY